MMRPFPLMSGKETHYLRLLAKFSQTNNLKSKIMHETLYQSRSLLEPL
jgi:hypothetical protein